MLPVRILCGRVYIYAVEDNISIVHAAFVGLYFIHELLRSSRPHLTLNVCTFECKNLKWLKSKIYPICQTAAYDL